MCKPKTLSHRPFTDVASSLARELAHAKKEKIRAERDALRARAPARRAPDPDDEEHDDGELFWRAMHDVEPLPKTRDHVPPLRERPPRLKFQDDDSEALAQLADLVAGEGEFDLASSDEHIEGISRGLNRRLVRRLRRGAFSCQGHLDLHGRTRVEARALVERFLVENRTRGKRCVLIVHGRGLNSKDQIPVLKESLRGWLMKGRIARIVLAFCSARPADGGAGAVYVLLRK